MRRYLVAGLLVLALVRANRGADPDPLAADERVLEAANVPTDTPALLDFFRQRTLTDRDRARATVLIGQLGDEDFETREKASRALVAFGCRLVPLLRPALKDGDLEVVRRAEECLRQIEEREKKIAGVVVPMAVVRLLAARKPAGAAEVLLAYLPFADREGVVDEMELALAALAVRAGKPEPALTAALTAPDALRRGVAGAALARSGVAGAKPAVRKLLQDPDLTVRVRVALALAVARDKEAIPVLIDLLGRLPSEQVGSAEELLRQLAGAKAPPVSPGHDAASREKCRAAWAIWWRDHAATVDMTALGAVRPYLGYTLVAAPDSGIVFELDRDGKIRWQIKTLQSPFDAQVLPGGRILVAEYRGRVTERNLNGDILWQKAVPSAMQCQRLPDGSTFVVSIRQLLVFDRDGKENVLYTHNGPGAIGVARKLPNGQIVAIDSSGNCMRLDATGKEQSRFPVGRISNNCMDVLANGNVLVAKFFDGKVTEYDAKGQVVWEVPCPSAFCPHRLPNGNTLVACHNPPQVVELNRAGQVVWKFDGQAAGGYRPWFASRR